MFLINNLSKLLFDPIGTTTPKRRNSTNPFEESPEEETKNGLSCGQSPVASAIADMTADFYNAINTYDGIEPPVAPSKQTTELIDPLPGGQPFDPFATIVDDETPKRQSLADDSSASLAANKVLSPDGSDPFADRQPIDSLQSPALPPPDSAFLTANEDHMNDYLSDLSDVEDNIDDKPTDPVINGSQRRRSSAFQMELLSGQLALHSNNEIIISLFIRNNQSISLNDFISFSNFLNYIDFNTSQKS